MTGSQDLFDPIIVKSILEKFGGEKTVFPKLTFTELYEGLNNREAALIHKLLELKPKDLGFYGPYIGTAIPPTLTPLSQQEFKRGGKTVAITGQHLPPHVFNAFQALKAALFGDLGTELMVESGYRSPAHQAITFLTHLEIFNFDLRYVASGVALPGYSQHGDPVNTALDVINQEGIPADVQPVLFSSTREYSWLVKNAHKFSFYLSYPEGNQYGVIFEPWHWQYRQEQA